MSGGCGGIRDICGVDSGTGRAAGVIWDPLAQAVPASTPRGAVSAWEGSMHIDYLLFDILPLILLS